MLTSPQFWAANLAAVRDRIAAATAAAGRPAGSVTLIAVSKTQPAATVAAIRGLGQADFGENYLQEALDKQSGVPAAGTVWHFIGQLQANKTRPAAEHFDWVHTVDRLRLAERLSAQRPASLPPLNVCLQVLLEPEPGKGGIAPDALPELAAAVAALPHLALRGLMCIPPPTTDADLLRQRFRRLRELQDGLNHSGHRLDCLSMGMSGDFEPAILEGATHVRVGTAIFGERSKREPAP
jgi:PLP dependent protein